jgi:hypothetical protein
MRRLATPVAVIALLAAGGFAAVSIAHGGGLAHITTTGLTTTGLTTTAGGKVTICHRTHSKKHPFHTISVAVPALRAHLRHGDVLGACTTATVAAMKKHGKGHARHTSTATTTTTGTSTQTTSPAAVNTGANGHGHGNADGNGNGHGHAGGNGKGGGGGKH